MDNKLDIHTYINRYDFGLIFGYVYNENEGENLVNCLFSGESIRNKFQLDNLYSAMLCTYMTYE